MNRHLYALIVAGGSGTRMNASIPKQYIALNGLPILMHTIKAFHQYDPALNIILVLPAHDFLYWEALCKQYAFEIPVTLAEGGATRFESVKNGLSKIKEGKGVVAIHDGVRPLISQNLIHNTFKTAEKYGNAVAAVALKDSVRIIVEESGNQTVDRNKLRLVQTPQVFDLSIIKKAYEEAKTDHFTDDASVVEALGSTIRLIEGDYKNIKITTREDLDIAACLLKAK